MSLPIELQLPTGFLESEVRCGYDVSCKLKKIWAVELDLFAKFAAVCKKHGLRYLAAYGTIIGAVRHKGFIPWDDDMDFWMPREDYETLRRIGGQEFGVPYFLQTAMSDPRFFCAFSRLRNSQTTAVVTDSISPQFNNGIFIDIYPLDVEMSSAFQNRWQSEVQRFIYRGAVLNRGRRSHRQSWRQWIGTVFAPFAKMVPYRSWVTLYDWIQQINNGKGNVLSPIFAISDHERGIRIGIDDIANSVWLDYEFLKVPVPRNYDKVLRTYYGDYMQFPPVESRGKWHEGQIRFDPDLPYQEWMKENGVLS